MLIQITKTDLKSADSEDVSSDEGMRSEIGDIEVEKKFKKMHPSESYCILYLLNCL